MAIVTMLLFTRKRGVVYYTSVWIVLCFNHILIRSEICHKHPAQPDIVFLLTPSQTAIIAVIKIRDWFSLH